MKQFTGSPFNVRRVGALIGLALLARVSVAHQFWVEPQSHEPKLGQATPVRLLVGDGFPGETYPRNPNHLVEFDCLVKEEWREISGFPNQDPAGFFVAKNQGFHLIRYVSRNSDVSLEAEKFNEYLEEEGLQEALAARGARDELNMDVVEEFRRCAIAYVSVGEVNSGKAPVVGMELELVANTDALEWTVGSEFRGRLLSNGKARPKRLIKFYHEEALGKPLFTRWTDENGAFEARMDRPGRWMLSSVEISGEGARYSSVWTSLTFEVQPKEADE